jgi:hypothetical protein
MDDHGARLKLIEWTIRKSKTPSPRSELAGTFALEFAGLELNDDVAC